MQLAGKLDQSEKATKAAAKENQQLSFELMNTKCRAVELCNINETLVNKFAEINGTKALVEQEKEQLACELKESRRTNIELCEVNEQLVKDLAETRKSYDQLHHKLKVLEQKYKMQR